MSKVGEWHAAIVILYISRHYYVVLSPLFVSAIGGTCVSCLDFSFLRSDETAQAIWERDGWIGGKAQTFSIFLVGVSSFLFIRLRLTIPSLLLYT